MKNIQFIKEKRNFLPTLFDTKDVYLSNGKFGRGLFIVFSPFLFIFLGIWTVGYMIQGKGDF